MLYPTQPGQGVNGDDQDLNTDMASPITRPEPHLKPLECHLKLLNKAEHCDRLVESIQRCMIAVINRYGYLTKYWFLSLSSNTSIVLIQTDKPDLNNTMYVSSENSTHNS